MIVIYPKYVNWAEPPELGLSIVPASYQGQLIDTIHPAGKVRRTWTFQLMEEYIDEFINLIESNHLQQYRVILPIFGMWGMDNPPLPDYEIHGQDWLYIKGNPYNRPMGFFSDLERAPATSSKQVWGMENVILMNPITKDYEEVKIISLDTWGGEEWGGPISSVIARIKDPVTIYATYPNWVIYNFFYARLVEASDTRKSNKWTGTMVLTFEEIFNNEVSS